MPTNANDGRCGSGDDRRNFRKHVLDELHPSPWMHAAIIMIMRARPMDGIVFFPHVASRWP